MLERKRGTIGAFAAAVIILTMGLSLSGGHVDAQENIGPKTDIIDVEISLENQTDFIVIKVIVNGTAGPGTDHVNVTALIDNGTGPEETVWLEETEFRLFGNEMTLKGIGSGEEEWSRWILRITLSIPKDGNLSSTLDMFGLLFGFDDINTEDVPSDIGDIEDIGEIDLNDTGMDIYIMARGVSDNGTYGEDMVLITDDIITALNDFLNPVIPVDDTDDDVLEPEEEDDEKDLSPLIVIAIFILGLALVLGSIGVILVIRKSGGDE